MYNKITLLGIKIIDHCTCFKYMVPFMFGVWILKLKHTMRVCDI